MDKLNWTSLFPMGTEIAPISGSDGNAGYNDSRDVLVARRTTDGVDFNTVWSEFQASVAIQNSSRQLIIDLLTFPVQEPTEYVQQLSSSSFERATEYGEPRGLRQKPTKFRLGYDFEWFDISIRYTWRFLSEVSQGQIDAQHASVLDADNRLVFGKIMDTLFSPDNRIATIDDETVDVFALYNGDGTVPPAYLSNTHDGTHTHYLVSGAAAVTSDDLDDLQEHLRHHGFGPENGVTQILLCNSREAKLIRKFRIETGAYYDFIPSTGEPVDRILNPGQSIAGNQPASTYQGLRVVGKYGELLIIENDQFPAGYLSIIGTGGAANLNNPIGLREHRDANLRGLKLVKGVTPDYPLMDSYYTRGFGTGIRQRGGAAVMQIKASGAYTPPPTFVS